MKKTIVWAIVNKQTKKIEDASSFDDGGCGCGCGPETTSLAIYSTRREAKSACYGEEYKIVRYELK